MSFGAVGQGADRSQVLYRAYDTWKLRAGDVYDHNVRIESSVREKEQHHVNMLREKYMDTKLRERAQSSKASKPSNIANYASSSLAPVQNPNGHNKFQKATPQSMRNINSMQPSYERWSHSRTNGCVAAPQPRIIRPNVNHVQQQAQQWDAASLDQPSRLMLNGLESVEPSKFVDAESLDAVLADAEGQTPPAPATPDSHTTSASSQFSSQLKSLASRQHPPDPAHPNPTPKQTTTPPTSAYQQQQQHAQQVPLPPSYPHALQQSLHQQHLQQQQPPHIHEASYNQSLASQSQLSSPWQLLPPNQMFYGGHGAGFGPGFMAQPQMQAWEFQQQQINYMRSQHMFQQQQQQHNSQNNINNNFG